MHMHAQMAPIASCLQARRSAAGFANLLLSSLIVSVMSSADQDTPLADAATTSAPDTPTTSSTADPSTSQMLVSLTARLTAIERAVLPSPGAPSTSSLQQG